MNTPQYVMPNAASEWSTTYVDATNVDASVRMPLVGERALVLHGGGAVGNAWEIGVIAGLADAGVDVTEADLVVGTSAGSTAAAQISIVRPVDLYAPIVAASPAAENTQNAPDRGRVPGGTVSDHLERTGRIIASASDVIDMRRRMGAAALELDATSDRSRHWRDVVAARLPSRDWPEHSLLITAVAHTGEPVVFDRHSGVDLVDAVAASTSSGAPYRIGSGRYVDGGYRRNENADLAAGYKRVLVLSPFGGRSRHPAEWGMDLATQVAELRAGGTKVETILPDSRSAEAFGTTMMDLARRPLSARAGYDQGHAVGGALGPFWH